MLVEQVKERTLIMAAKLTRRIRFTRKEDGSVFIGPLEYTPRRAPKLARDCSWSPNYTMVEAVSIDIDGTVQVHARYTNGALVVNEVYCGGKLQE